MQLAFKRGIFAITYSRILGAVLEYVLKREECILCGQHEMSLKCLLLLTSLAVMNMFHGMRVPMPCNTRVR